MALAFDTARSVQVRSTSHGCGLHVRLVALAVAAAISMSANAQSGEEVDVLDEVLVSGKRAIDSGASALGTRALRDTPFSVVAVTSEEIEKHQSASLAAVFAKDASVSREGGTDYNLYAQRISVRGLSLDWVNSVRVNGLPLTYYGATLPLEAVEEVHLLKGASGFLYGVGAPGGIVNYLTKRPTSTQTLTINVGYRSDQLFSQHLDVGGRLGDGGFGYRINLVNERGDTYTGANVNRKAATAAFEVPLVEGLTWVTDLLYQDSRVDRPEPLFVLDTTAYSSENMPLPVDGGRNLASDQSFSNTEFISGTTGLVWKFAGSWDLNVNYGKTYTDYRFPYESIRLQDVGGTYQNRLADFYDVFDYDFARALVQGHFQTGQVGHHLTTGVSWQDLAISYGTTNYTQHNQPGGNLYEYSPETWTVVYDGIPPHARASHYLEKSIYLSDTISFTEKLSVLAGARLTRYLQESFNINTGVRTSRYEKDVATPSLAMMYKPQPSVTTYLSYVQSLQQGPTVGAAYDNAGEQLNPIESDQYELGVKAERSTWAASAAIFRLSKGATYVNSNNTLVQGGEQRYDGLEVAARFRLGRHLTLGGSAVLLDAEYTKGVSDWLLGRRMPGSSRFSGALDVSYVVPSLPGLNLHADIKFTGGKVVNHIQAADLTVSSGGFAVANAGGNWVTELAGYDVTFSAQIRNILDRRYWDGASSAFSPGAPRSLALSARVAF